MEVAFSLEPAPSLVPAREAPLLVLVGLTGVGKSTLVEALGLPRLPDRRELVDRFVLPRYGAEPPHPPGGALPPHPALPGGVPRGWRRSSPGVRAPEAPPPL